MAEPNFEKDLEKLEGIVTALEEGGLSLDESLKRFEEGIKLTQRCEKALTEAEKRIEILTKKSDGEYEAETFNEDPGPEEKTPRKRAEKKAPPEHENEDEEDEDDGELLF